jgi:hypothetical protein
MNNKDNRLWKQEEVIHCPIIKCNGMLLQNKYFHAMKCSDCERLFILDTKYTEINKTELF